MVVSLGEGYALWRGVVGPFPGCPDGGGGEKGRRGVCTLSLITCPSWKKGWEPLHLLTYLGYLKDDSPWPR